MMTTPTLPALIALFLVFILVPRKISACCCSKGDVIERDSPVSQARRDSPLHAVPNVPVRKADSTLRIQVAPAPRSSHESDMGPDSAKSWPALIQCDVLVVDDQFINLRTAKRQLERLGLSVHLLLSGSEAESFFRAGHTASVVFMDYSMPGKDGLETTTNIRKAACELDTRFILNSSEPQETLEILLGHRFVNALGNTQLVFDGIFKKPYTADELRPFLTRYFPRISASGE